MCPVISHCSTNPLEFRLFGRLSVWLHFAVVRWVGGAVGGTCRGRLIIAAYCRRRCFALAPIPVFSHAPLSVPSPRRGVALRRLARPDRGQADRRAGRGGRVPRANADDPHQGGGLQEHQRHRARPDRGQTRPPTPGEYVRLGRNTRTARPDRLARREGGDRRTRNRLRLDEEGASLHLRRPEDDQGQDDPAPAAGLRRPRAGADHAAVRRGGPGAVQDRGAHPGEGRTARHPRR